MHCDHMQLPALGFAVGRGPLHSNGSDMVPGRQAPARPTYQGQVAIVPRVDVRHGGTRRKDANAREARTPSHRYTPKRGVKRHERGSWKSATDQGARHVRYRSLQVSRQRDCIGGIGLAVCHVKILESRAFSRHGRAGVDVGHESSRGSSSIAGHAALSRLKGRNRAGDLAWQSLAPAGGNRSNTALGR
jgi:hypothetical protein